MRAIGLFVVVSCLCPGVGRATPKDESARAAIAAFNRAWSDATRRMDDAATLALWEDDGVSLLPGKEPLRGKTALRQLLADVHARLPGATMKSFESECFDIEVAGAWASEWCVEHQVVALAGGRPPFDGRGRMLVVLHRGPDGRWRLAREMWSRAPQPAAPQGSTRHP